MISPINPLKADSLSDNSPILFHLSATMSLSSSSCAYCLVNNSFFFHLSSWVFLFPLPSPLLRVGGCYGNSEFPSCWKYSLFQTVVLLIFRPLCNVYLHYFPSVPIKKDLAMEMLSGSTMVSLYPAPNPGTFKDALPVFLRLVGLYYQCTRVFKMNYCKFFPESLTKLVATWITP